MQTHDTPSTDPVRALLHSWFVTYNPIYLASAALVLTGVGVADRALASEGGPLGLLGMPAVAELYALALIGSAAVLHRVGERRVAAMLGLLASLFACDLTLHTAAAPLLGPLGWLSSAAWVLLFAVKARLLSWALGLSPSRDALATSVLGAGVVALVPHVLPYVDDFVGGVLVTAAVFAVALFASTTGRAVGRDGGFDVRGRRSVRGVWWLLAAAGLVHVAHTVLTAGVPALPVIAGLALAVAHRASERMAWLLVAGGALWVALADPAFLSLIALLGAVTLALCAVHERRTAGQAEVLEAPYRGDGSAALEVITELAEPPVSFHPAPAEARARFLAGAAACAHLSLASVGAQSLAFEHAWLLDGLVVASAFAVWRVGRSRVALLSPVPMLAHAAVIHRDLWVPGSRLVAGAWAIGLGFLLLAAGVGASVRAHRDAGRAG